MRDGGADEDIAKRTQPYDFAVRIVLQRINLGRSTCSMKTSPAALLPAFSAYLRA